MWATSHLWAQATEGLACGVVSSRDCEFVDSGQAAEGLALGGMPAAAACPAALLHLRWVGQVAAL